MTWLFLLFISALLPTGNAADARAIGSATGLPAEIAAAMRRAGHAGSTSAHGGAFSVFGNPRYGAGFTHFAHANPDAPKGCTLRISERAGSFDSINPFILKGRQDLGVFHYVNETLMASSGDEIGAVYPRLARAMEMAEDESSVTFHLDPRAHWHDGKPVTSADMAYTAELFRRHGRPHWRTLFRNYPLEIIDERSFRFKLSGDQRRRVALDLAGLHVLPKHFWETRDFDRTTIEPLLGSGPYRVGDVQLGRSVTLERVPDYWGRDLPSVQGRYNYDRMISEYFYNDTTRFEAFKRGQVDIHIEADVRRWQTGYDSAPIESGRMIRLSQPNWFTIGMNGFFFNLRQERFQDIRVRKAFEALFDFQWVNRNIFHGIYERTSSYFENSEFSASLAPSEEERTIMRQYPALFPPESFEAPWQPSANDGSGADRTSVRKAVALFTEAGWNLRDGRLINAMTGERMRIVVLAQTATQEKILGQYFEQLRRVGIEAQHKIVDGATYEHLVRNGEFDLYYRFIIQPQWPGREQRRAWSSADPERVGSNPTGLADAGIDALVEKVVAAETLDQLTLAARLLDRALQWGYYAIPGYHDNHRRVAYWNRFDRPNLLPKYSYGLDYWWCKDAAK